MNEIGLFAVFALGFLCGAFSVGRSVRFSSVKDDKNGVTVAKMGHPDNKKAKYYASPQIRAEMEEMKKR